MLNKMKVEGLVALFVAIVAVAGFSSNAMAAPQPKVHVCHDGKSIRINGNALQAHMNHGDVPGKCGEIVLSEWLDLRCDSSPTNGGTFLVSNVSHSLGVSPEIDAIIPTDDCATTQKIVQDAHCRLARDYGTPDAQVYVFHCPETEAVADPS